MDTMDELEEALHQYFTDETCEEIIELRYTEVDGELYFDNGGYGLDASYIVKDETVYKSGSGWNYELDCSVKYIDGSEYKETLKYYFESSGGNYVFDMDLEVQAVHFD